MAKTSASAEARIVEFFSNAPLIVASTLANVVKGIIKQRNEASNAEPLALPKRRRARRARKEVAQPPAAQPEAQSA